MTFDERQRLRVEVSDALKSRRVADRRKAKPGPQRCGYCGVITRGRACWAHLDLLRLDGQAAA